MGSRFSNLSGGSPEVAESSLSPGSAGGGGSGEGSVGGFSAFNCGHGIFSITDNSSGGALFPVNAGCFEHIISGSGIKDLNSVC